MGPHFPVTVTGRAEDVVSPRGWKLASPVLPTL